MSETEALKAKLLGEIETATDLDALEALRVAALGKAGSVTGLLKTLGGMTPEERQAEGPKIHGLLTGLVEPRPDARLGTVADLDEEGRYTVRLLFDASPLDERQGSSHRVRMIQLHAGPDYGAHFPLKAGVEVLLAFVDGDPDRPLIVGAAPNPVTRSPVTAADSLMHRLKTSTGILIEMKDHYD